MTGFKSGASDDDPYSDDNQETDTDRGVEPEPDSKPIEDDAHDTGGAVKTEPVKEMESAGGGGDLPWIYKRSSITDGRDTTVQLHLQDSTLQKQRQVRVDLGDRLGESVPKADLREAALLVGLAHSGEVAAKLREWGYDQG